MDIKEKTKKGFNYNKILIPTAILVSAVGAYYGYHLYNNLSYELDNLIKDNQSLLEAKKNIHLKDNLSKILGVENTMEDINRGLQEMPRFQLYDIMNNIGINLDPGLTKNEMILSIIRRLS